MAYENAQSFFEGHLAESLKSSPDKGKNINAVIVFKITGDNGGDWTVDLTKTPGEVAAGAAATPKTTFTVASADFLDIINK